MSQGTRYILAGGYDLLSPEYPKRLKKALVGRKQDNLLGCFFSKPEHQWLSTYQSFASFYGLAFPGAKTALALPQTFIEQVTHADIIYLHGGETKRLTTALQKYPNIQELFNGKTIIGSSAGANFLSTIWWSFNIRQAGKGSGITPLNTVVHYQSHMNDNDHRGPVNWEQSIKDVATLAGKNATITPIPEGELVIYDA